MNQSSRLIPLMVAGIICFAAAFVLGAGFWYLLGTKSPGGGGGTVVQISNQNSAANQPTANANATNVNQNINAVAAPPETASVKIAPAGESKVSGGEVMLGGGKTKMPLRRVEVKDFAIGETEVTNTQYAEFIEDTDHAAPTGWQKGKFAADKGDYPIVGITWADANDYCAWLSKKIDATVRLPSEAEWERAARGDQTGYKYPWGNDWIDEAVLPDGAVEGEVFPVGSALKGRSQSGAYEMSGNVWEWTSDLWTDEFGNSVLREKVKQRVIKGGSVLESKIESAAERDKFLTVAARLNRPENEASELLGFRYVVIR